MLRHPIQVYRDLLWDSPHPIRWVQGQIVAVILRFVALVLLPPPLYRLVSPWLVATSRAVAPACLVAAAWWPALMALLGGRAGGAGPSLDLDGGALPPRPGDEYIEFSLRWYPLMDVAFTAIHPTSIVVEIVYGIFSLSCILAMGLPALPGKRLPRGFFLPQQLAKCVLSSCALLAIERWRLLHDNNDNRSDGVSSSGARGGSASGRISNISSSASVDKLEGEAMAAAAACCLTDSPDGGSGDADRATQDDLADPGAGERGCPEDPRQRRQAEQPPPPPALRPPQRQRSAESQRAESPRRISLRLIAAETRRLYGCTSRDGDGGGPAGGWVPLVRQRSDARRLDLHSYLRAAHASLLQMGMGMGPTELSAPDGSPPPPPPPHIRPAAEHEEEQPPQVLLHARPFLPYAPFRARSPAATRFNSRSGGAALHPEAARSLAPAPPPLPLPGSSQHATGADASATAGAAAAAAAEVGAEGQHQLLQRRLHRPGHVPYISRTAVYSTRIKLDGCEPEQVAPGYTERIARVVAAAGLQLEAVALRRGCIELLIETRAVDGAPPAPAGAAAALTPLLRPPARHAPAVVGAPPAVTPSAAAAASSSGAALESGSDCRWTHRRISSSVLGPCSGSSTCADTPPADPWDDVLDIGALIRALQLPESSSLELGLAPASSDDGYGSDGNHATAAAGAAAGSWAAPPDAGALRALETAAAYDATGAGVDGVSDGQVMVAAAAGAAVDPRAGNWVGSEAGATQRCSDQFWWEAHVAQSAAAAPLSSWRRLLLPDMLDVYPRILLMGPVSGAAGSLDPQPTPQPGTAAAAATSVSASATLVMAVSWVASSPDGAHEPPGPDNAWTPLAAEAATMSVSEEQRDHGVSAGAITAAGGPVPAPPTPTAQILLWSHGEVVAVASVAASAAAAITGAAQTATSKAEGALQAAADPSAAAVASASAGAAMAVAAELSSFPPPPAAPNGADVGCAAAGCLTADRHRPPPTQYEASAPGGASPAPSPMGGERSSGSKGGVSGGGAALGSEALYSLDVGPLLERLRPGVVLIEAKLDSVSQPAAAAAAGRANLGSHAPAAVPVLVVDDPRVAGELQRALETWCGTPNEVDNLLYDMGALTRLQDELMACAGNLAAAAAGWGGAALHLTAMSARTTLLYNHVVSYTEVMSWEAVRAWLCARQQAATEAVAAAHAAATAEVGRHPAAATVAAAAATASVRLPRRTDSAGKRSAAGGPVTCPEPTTNTIDAAAAATTAAGPHVGLAATVAAVPADEVPRSRRSFSVVVPRRCLSSVQRPLHLLLLVLGWRTEGEADAAAYAAYTALFAASMMNVMQMLDLLGFLTIITRSRASIAAASWPELDKACVLVAASPGVVLGALWLALPRPAWRRISARAKWPRQLWYTLAKAMVAFQGFPQPPSTLWHELGGSIFLVEGVILPAAVLMSPLESVLMGLVRAPLCARMWLLADGGRHHTPRSAALRALALSALNVLTTIAVHMYIRMSYERQVRGSKAG